MALKGSSVDNIPHFLSARTPVGLRRAMLKNNMFWGMIFDYHKIYRDPVDNKLYAWYQMNAVEEMEAVELKAKQDGK